MIVVIALACTVVIYLSQTLQELREEQRDGELRCWSCFALFLCFRLPYWGLEVSAAPSIILRGVGLATLPFDKGLLCELCSVGAVRSGNIAWATWVCTVYCVLCTVCCVRWVLWERWACAVCVRHANKTFAQ